MPIGIDFVKALLEEDFNSVFEQRISDEEAHFILPFSGFHLVVRVINDSNKDFLSVRIPAITQLKNEHRAAVLEKAMHLNYRMIVGKYGFDPHDGELEFEAVIATDGFQEPWESYAGIVRRLIGVALNNGGNDAQFLREMSYTGKWPESKEKPGAEDPYESLVMPIKTGAISLSKIAEAKRDEVVDILIKLSISPGKDKVEDYPEEWQEVIRKKMGSGSGTEI